MQRYFGIEKINNNLILDSSDYHHIKNVMRMKDDDKVEVVIDNKVYLGCIENVKSNISIKLIRELEILEDSMPQVNLIIPLLKENKMDLILQKSAEMGVSKITICPFSRCMVKVNEKIDNKINRWMRIVKEASEQSFRNSIPEVSFISKIEELKDLSGVNFVCSTRKIENNLKMVLTKTRNCDTINIVIGPEGGLSNEEEDYLNSIGYDSVTLGRRIMRVESVPLFILSIINYEYME